MLVGHKLTVKMNLSLGLLSYGTDNRPIGSSIEAFTITGFGLLGTMSHQCSWMLVYWLPLPGPCTYSRDSRFMCLTRANDYHCESHTHPCCLSCRCCCKNIRPTRHTHWSHGCLWQIFVNIFLSSYIIENCTILYVQDHTVNCKTFKSLMQPNKLFPIPSAVGLLTISYWVWAIEVLPNFAHIFH
jgi:hypothetical protein